MAWRRDRRNVRPIMRDSLPSPGRSLAIVVVMLVAFAVFAALFVALDMAAGVPIHLTGLFAAPSATVGGVGMAAAHEPGGVYAIMAQVVLG